MPLARAIERYPTLTENTSSLVTRRPLLDVGLRKTLTRPTEQPSGIFGQSGVPLNRAPGERTSLRFSKSARLKWMEHGDIRGSGYETTTPAVTLDYYGYHRRQLAKIIPLGFKALVYQASVL